MKKLIFFIILILFIQNIYGYDLKDFPKPFVNKNCTNFVIIRPDEDSKSSQILENKFRSIFSSNKQCYEISSIPTDEIDFSILNNNLILIGGPCANKLTAIIINHSDIWPECSQGFKEGKGRIIAFNKSGNIQIIIAGFSQDDTHKAAEVFSNYSIFGINGKKIEVLGDINNLKIRQDIIDDTKQILWLDIKFYPETRLINFNQDIDIYNYSWYYDEDYYESEVSKNYGGNYSILMINKLNQVYLSLPLKLRTKRDALVVDRIDKPEFHVFPYATTLVELPYNEYLKEIQIFYGKSKLGTYNSSNFKFYKTIT